MFLRDEAGGTALEYAMIASMLSIAILAGVSLVASNLGILVGEVADAVDNAGK